jgi:Rieske Fe-S protein
MKAFFKAKTQLQQDEIAARPCHGAIFGPEGQVLNAPAISGLNPIS